MVVALVMGNMMGSGIFLLHGSLAAYGGLSVVGWLVSTAGALALALRVCAPFTGSRRVVRVHATGFRRPRRLPGRLGLLDFDLDGSRTAPSPKSQAPSPRMIQ
jgi:hypothetical protein